MDSRSSIYFLRQQKRFFEQTMKHKVFQNKTIKYKKEGKNSSIIIGRSVYFWSPISPWHSATSLFHTFHTIPTISPTPAWYFIWDPRGIPSADGSPVMFATFQRLIHAARKRKRLSYKTSANWKDKKVPEILEIKYRCVLMSFSNISNKNRYRVGRIIALCYFRKRKHI